MTITRSTDRPSAPKNPRPASPPPNDEPRVIVRGRVSHVEHEIDQPEPMPVRKSGDRPTASR